MKWEKNHVRAWSRERSGRREASRFNLHGRYEVKNYNPFFFRNFVVQYFVNNSFNW